MLTNKKTMKINDSCMHVFTSIASNVHADGHGNIKMGIILGFTGPIEHDRYGCIC